MLEPVQDMEAKAHARTQVQFDTLTAPLLRVVMLVVDLMTTLLPLELMTPTKSIKMDDEQLVCYSRLTALRYLVLVSGHWFMVSWQA